MTFLLADKRNAFIIHSGRWLSALLVTGLLCLPARIDLALSPGEFYKPLCAGTSLRRTRTLAAP